MECFCASKNEHWRSTGAKFVLRRLERCRKNRSSALKKQPDPVRCRVLRQVGGQLREVWPIFLGRLPVKRERIENPIQIHRLVRVERRGPFACVMKKIFDRQSIVRGASCARVYITSRKR